MIGLNSLRLFDLSLYIDRLHLKTEQIVKNKCFIIVIIQYMLYGQTSFCRYNLLANSQVCILNLNEPSA